MKKAFRAAIASLFAIVFAVVGLSAVMSVSADAAPVFTETNIALIENGGVGFADTVYKDSKKGTTCLNDNIQNDDSYWRGVGTEQHYAGIYWASKQTFNTIVIKWKHVPGDPALAVDYAKENAKIDDTTNESGVAFKTASASVIWNGNLVKDTDYRIDRYSTESDSKPVDIITFAAPVTTDMVKIMLSGSFNDGCSTNFFPGEIYELEVYNTNVAETIIGNGNVEAETDVVAGLKSVFVATNVAKADLSANAYIKASYTITKADGTKAEGVKFITSAYKSIALGKEVIIAEDADDYVTGILFNNVPENATIEVVFTVAE